MARISWTSGVGLTLVLCAQLAAYGAVPPSEDLLPNTTKGYLSVANVDEMRDAFNKTQMGILANDPAMKPFVEDLQRQLSEQWTKTHEKLGIGWEDFEGVPTGEVAVAVILLSETADATVVLADVTGHEAQAQGLLAKIDEEMATHKAVRSERRVHGATVVVFDVPKRDDLPARQVAYFSQDGLLAATDDLKVIESLLNRQAGGANAESLSALPAFKSITKRCQKAAGDLAPQARWFIEPFGYADAARLDRTKKRGTDMLKILKTEGFTAIEGIGGFVNFSVEPIRVAASHVHLRPGQPVGRRAVRAVGPDAQVPQRRRAFCRPSGCRAIWPPTRLSTWIRRTRLKTPKLWSTRSWVTKYSRTCSTRSRPTRTGRKSTSAAI